MSKLEQIDVFWFKRDLRLFDNEALKSAMASPRKSLLVYLHEPHIWQDVHYDERHMVFIQESLDDLNEALSMRNIKILAIRSEIVHFLGQLAGQFHIHTIFSTQETGLDITFKRDVTFARYCSGKNIRWKEYQNNGVVRGLTNRKQWSKAWYDYMNAPLEGLDWSTANCFNSEEVDQIIELFQPFTVTIEPHCLQQGGRSEALRWKESFFSERIAYYNQYISKPEMARYGCSRLSPYFAWGNLSIREVFQEATAIKKMSPHKRQINAFMSRLRWQSHFIQKFEMEPRMEYQAVNKGFLSLEQPLNTEFVALWKAGKTGYPLVDASMRCVAQTGYINFRMRSMVTSFLTHHLFQHFTTGGPWLARQFLDFEPGIHYGQMQMQAGFTGTNTVRVYNPVKNAHDHDNDAVFIKKHVPELQNLPANLAIEPWKVTAMETELYQFQYGIDYPRRLVDISKTRTIALQKLYGQRKGTLAESETARILETHTIRRKAK